MEKPKITTTKYPGIYKYEYSSGKVSYRTIVTKRRKQFPKVFSKLEEAKRYKGITEESLRTNGVASHK